MTNPHYDMIKLDYLKFVTTDCRFEYPVGWNSIIDSLFSNIELYYEANKDKFLHRVPTFNCLKEKFGQGRFYLSRNSDEITDLDGVYKIITIHEDRTIDTCEVCGKKDSKAYVINGGRLVSTRCSEHTENGTPFDSGRVIRF